MTKGFSSTGSIPYFFTTQPIDVDKEPNPVAIESTQSIHPSLLTRNQTSFFQPTHISEIPQISRQKLSSSSQRFFMTSSKRDDKSLPGVSVSSRGEYRFSNSSSLYQWVQKQASDQPRTFWIGFPDTEDSTASELHVLDSEFNPQQPWFTAVKLKINPDQSTEVEFLNDSIDRGYKWYSINPNNWPTDNQKDINSAFKKLSSHLRIHMRPNISDMTELNGELTDKIVSIARTFGQHGFYDQFMELNRLSQAREEQIDSQINHTLNYTESLDHFVKRLVETLGVSEGFVHIGDSTSFQYSATEPLDPLFWIRIDKKGFEHAQLSYFSETANEWQVIDHPSLIHSPELDSDLNVLDDSVKIDLKKVVREYWVFEESENALIALRKTLTGTHKSRIDDIVSLVQHSFSNPFWDENPSAETQIFLAASSLFDRLFLFSPVWDQISEASSQTQEIVSKGLEKISIKIIEELLLLNHDLLAYLSWDESVRLAAEMIYEIPATTIEDPHFFQSVQEATESWGNSEVPLPEHIIDILKVLVEDFLDWQPQKVPLQLSPDLDTWH